MRVPKASLDIVWVSIGINFCVVAAVIRAPLQKCALKRTGCEKNIEPFDQRMNIVTAVREIAMIAASDAHVIEDEANRKERP
jgi:hypothetical protein